ncbi:MAG: ROK family protein [Acidimicrobiales bacterium]
MRGPHRPAERDDGLCIALDIGGTKLAVAVVRGDGEVCFEDRISTPHAADGEALYRVVADLVAIASAEAIGWGTVRALGVGCGGPMTRGGRQVSPLNIASWRAFPLRARLVASIESLLGHSVPVFVDNDAKAVALAEGWLGAARGEDNYMAMVVSTGIGGGIVLDGCLLDGASGNAGHIGHVIVEPGGRACSCGARGCLEAEASGSAIAAVTGRRPEAADAEVIDRTGRLVGRAVASVANLLDLRLCLVGGSVALGFGTPFFLAAARELSTLARLDHSRDCRIEPVGLSSTAPLVGAAAIAWRGLRTRDSSDARALEPKARRATLVAERGRVL